MKFAIFSLVIIGVLVFYFLFKKPKGKPILGNLTDFDSMIFKLIESKNDDSFLIIQISNSTEFIQFKYYEEEGLEIDFPLVTDTQKQLKNKIIEYCKNSKLNYKINSSSDNENEFIDIYIKAGKEELIQKVKQIYMDIHKINENTVFEFTSN